MSVSTLPRAGRLYQPEFVLPARAMSQEAVAGHELVDLRNLGIMPGVAGGARGFNTQGDVVTETNDGVPLNDLWRAYQEFLAEFNRLRDPLLNFLTWRTTRSREDIVGGGTQADFEEASEFGVPVGIRPEAPPTTSMGYTFKWYDLSARFTWMYLADSDAQQIDAIANMAAEASNRNLFNKVMQTLFNPGRRQNKEGQVVYSAYAGAVGDKPPAQGTVTFADQHQHYVTTGSTTLVPAHLEALQQNVREHGYKRTAGYSLILMINEAQEGVIRQFRSTANGGQGTYDFVPAQGTSPLLLPTDVRLADNGVTRPPASINGMEVVGAYAEMTIVKNEFIPAGYMVLFATGGPESVQNPVAIREHAKAGLRGMRLVKGRQPDYPLIDSYFNHGFGTGMRHRGALAIMQITNSGSYAVPAVYAWT